MLKKRRQAGDTIVEVMVALAVLGLAIGICYATARRSLMNARQAQETSQATAVLHSQVELLHAWASDSAHSAIYSVDDPDTFCIKSDGSIDTNNGDKCSYGLYSTWIVYSPADAVNTTSGGTFTLTANWDDVAGQGQDSATLIYKVYPNE